ncbi:alginate lyase family protein [Catalinimonas alkaloidigena]|uniref:alginate lyase family protein n=1 Tax=Catalinimonas alkaloidigena TaxID=1075417 RepID=UPI002407162B|nr:alginate lyase family protein [Catalinimonas alkaloidigena]
MKKLVLPLIGILLLAINAHSQNTTLIDLEHIREVKEHKFFFKNEISELMERADALLDMQAVSVMDKEMVASSGDKHDYMSQGPYWWPDPDKPDGLPYIRRDGEKNPEIELISDKKNLHKLIDAVDLLGLAYFYSEDEKYAKKASDLLHTWFIDPATRMNPNLNFGQAIPGRTEGRGIGIIETRDFGYLLDAITLLSTSEAMTQKQHESLISWVKDYLDWLINSQHGKNEAVNGNNHTTWYFVQTMSMALFTEQHALAQELQANGLKLILDSQIEADGSQPEELARTRTWDYSSMNLMAIYYYAILSEKVGKAVWDYNDQIIRKALDFLLPYLNEENEWKYQQITEFNVERLFPVLIIAANHYSEGIYEHILYQKYHLPEDELMLTLRFP